MKSRRESTLPAENPRIRGVAAGSVKHGIWIQKRPRVSAAALYTAPRMCQFSRVRFLLPIPLVLALLYVGCASTPMERFNKKLAKQEGPEREENSRLLEQRRVSAVENGQVGSKRGAEIFAADKYKTFDPTRNSVGGRTYDTGNARVKDFYYDQKAHPGSYAARDFYGAKKDWSGDLKYAARDANTRGKYDIPNATKAADTKTAATKESWDAGKTAATKGLHDGQREYLGPESKKLRTPVDPATMADWRNGGRETVVNSGTSVEKYTTLKQLTIEDIRELLNKNK